VCRSTLFYVILVNVSLSNKNCCLLIAIACMDGSALWKLNSPHVESVCATWRKGLRRVWRLPPATHCALLAPLSNSLTAINCYWFVTFLQRCFFSCDSYLVRLINNYGAYVGCMFSLMGSNFSSAVPNIMTIYWNYHWLIYTGIAAVCFVLNWLMSLLSYLSFWMFVMVHFIFFMILAMCCWDCICSL